MSGFLSGGWIWALVLAGAVGFVQVGVYLDGLIRDKARNETILEVAKRSRELAKDAEKLREQTTSGVNADVYRKLRDRGVLPFARPVGPARSGDMRTDPR